MSREPMSRELKSREPVGSARPLTPEARRALAEAQARRAAVPDRPAPEPEINGRRGPEPVRFGDWEVKGIATDF